MARMICIGIILYCQTGVLCIFDLFVWVNCNGSFDASQVAGVGAFVGASLGRVALGVIVSGLLGEWMVGWMNGWADR